MSPSVESQSGKRGCLLRQSHHLGNRLLLTLKKKKVGTWKKKEHLRRVDSSTLVFSLSSHRHSYIGLVLGRFIINNCGNKTKTCFIICFEGGLTVVCCKMTANLQITHELPSFFEFLAHISRCGRGREEYGEKSTSGRIKRKTARS